MIHYVIEHVYMPEELKKIIRVMNVQFVLNGNTGEYIRISDVLIKLIILFFLIMDDSLTEDNNTSLSYV